MSYTVYRGKIEMEYVLEHDNYIKKVESESGKKLTDEEKLNYFIDAMADDVIDLRFSDIKPAIEMEVVIED